MPVTILDIAKMNGADGVAGLIDETSQAHPEITMGAARSIEGINYKTLIRTGLPTVGFRKANKGVVASQSAYENRLIEAFIFNPRWQADKAVADCHEDGAQALLAIEAAGIIEASWQHIASQFYYGVANDADGFPGLISAYDATNMVVDAAGTTADTGSSVWAVRFGPRHVQWVLGEGGTFALSDVREGDVLDDDGNPYTAYIQEMLQRIGLQVGSTLSVARIKKLTADSGKGLTDDLVYDLFETFPSGTEPDVLLMSKRSRGQLRKSRTATNDTGKPAPMPTEVEGVPIHVTDAISDTEALTL